MIAIALDTNIWIYLAKNKFSFIMESLEKLIENRRTVVLINDVVDIEWKRNEQQTKKDFGKVVKTFFDEAKNLKDILPREQDRNDYQEIFSRIQNSPNWIDEVVEKRMERVKTLMHSCVNTPITDAQKLYVADLAIEKKGPFLRNKNNFDDALILRSFSEYVESKNDIYNEFIFVTDNEQDFIDSSTGRIYSEIITGINVSVKNVKDLVGALKLLPGVRENEQLDYEIDAWIEWQAEIAMGR